MAANDCTPRLFIFSHRPKCAPRPHPRSYSQRSDDPRQDLPIHTRPSFIQLLGALFLDFKPMPLTVTASTHPPPAGVGGTPQSGEPTRPATNQPHVASPSGITPTGSHPDGTHHPTHAHQPNAPHFWSAAAATAYITHDLKVTKLHPSLKTLPCSTPEMECTP